MIFKIPTEASPVKVPKPIIINNAIWMSVYPEPTFTVYHVNEITYNVILDSGSGNDTVKLQSANVM